MPSTLDHAEDEAGQGPLAGIRVLEFASFVAGPLAGRILAGLGAEVIKVEPPTGDPFRGWGAAGSATGQMFGHLNIGKKSVVADLSDPEESAKVTRLVRSADAVLVSSRPGALAKFGLAREDCLRVNPRLVHVNVTGFGPEGPLAAQPSYDLVAQGMSGLLDALGDGVPPQLPAFADLVTGIAAATGVLAGLAGTGRGHVGMSVDTSLMEAVTMLMLPSLATVQDTTSAPERQALAFRVKAADATGLVIQVSNSEKFWSRLVDLMGSPELRASRFQHHRDRLRHYDEIQALLQRAVQEEPHDVWSERLRAADIPFGPVFTVAQAREQPQIDFLGLLQPGEGLDTATLQPAWRVDDERPRFACAAPGLGQHQHLLSAEL